MGADNCALQQALANASQIAALMLKGNIVPDNEITIAPAMLKYLFWRVEMIEHRAQQISAG